MSSSREMCSGDCDRCAAAMASVEARIQQLERYLAQLQKVHATQAKALMAFRGQTGMSFENVCRDLDDHDERLLDLEERSPKPIL